MFNTPTPRARPGYLKMVLAGAGTIRPLACGSRGWRLSAASRAKVPAADLGASPSDCGDDPAVALSDDADVGEHARAGWPGRVRTAWDVACDLRWRFRGELLGHRILRSRGPVERRRRAFRREEGAAMEATIGALWDPRRVDVGRRGGGAQSARRHGADFALLWDPHRLERLSNDPGKVRRSTWRGSDGPRISTLSWRGSAAPHGRHRAFSTTWIDGRAASQEPHEERRDPIGNRKYHRGERLHRATTAPPPKPWSRAWSSEVPQGSRTSGGRRSR